MSATKNLSDRFWHRHHHEVSKFSREKGHYNEVVLVEEYGGASVTVQGGIPTVTEPSHIQTMKVLWLVGWGGSCPLRVVNATGSSIWFWYSVSRMVYVSVMIITLRLKAHRTHCFCVRSYKRRIEEDGGVLLWRGKLGRKGYRKVQSVW